MTNQSFENDEAMKSFVIHSVNDITDLFKVISHPKRLEILSLMVTKKYDFKTLMEETDLPKSALSNHLSALNDKNLLSKVDRGEYDITLDGIELIQNVSSLFLNMKIREQERLESRQKKLEILLARYTKFRPDQEEVSETTRSKHDLSIEIKDFESFKMIGVVGRGKNGPSFIPQIWEQFNQRYNEVKDFIVKDYGIGVMNNFDKDGFFEYNAGVVINTPENIPEGMAVWDVPAQKYVVFTCTIPTVMESIQHIFKEWFPTSDYEPSMGPEFELYPNEFDPRHEGDEFFYYIPVKAK